MRRSAWTRQTFPGSALFWRVPVLFTEVAFGGVKGVHVMSESFVSEEPVRGSAAAAEQL